MDCKFNLNKDFCVFKDTLFQGKPCVFTTPRNHESLFFVTDGELHYTNGSTKTVIPTGCVGYIARGSCDMSSSGQGSDVSYIAFNFNFAYDDEKDKDYKNLPFENLCGKNMIYDYEELFNKCFEYYQHRLMGYEIICRGIIMQIVGLIYNESNMEERNKYSVIERGLKFINENYSDNDMKIRDASRLCNISEVHFRRIFKEMYSISPSAYLQKIRIMHAKDLLSGTAKTVSEISASCGYSDVYSFSHAFKSITGVSPSVWKIKFN